MEQYIVKTMPYEELQKKVLEGNDGGIEECDTLPTENIKTNTLYKIPAGLFWYDGTWHQLIDNDDIVVPDTNTSYRGTAGLVHMYNASSGLRLDDNKRMCIAAATKEEIKAKASINKPIVPYYLDEAVKAGTYQDDLAKITSDNSFAALPASALSVLNCVTQSTPSYKIAYVEKGGTFEIKPGMLALALPYTDSSDAYTISFHDKNKSTIISDMGATIVFAADKKEAGDACTAKGNFRLAVLYAAAGTLGVTTAKSNHNQYAPGCYIQNDYKGTEGSGIMYVFYLERGN